MVNLTEVVVEINLKSRDCGKSSNNLITQVGWTLKGQKFATAIKQMVLWTKFESGVLKCFGETNRY